MFCRFASVALCHRAFHTDDRSLAFPWNVRVGYSFIRPGDWLGGVLWIGCVGRVIVWHATWSINRSVSVDRE
jgi:hypothetical protein